MTSIPEEFVRYLKRTSRAYPLGLSRASFQSALERVQEEGSTTASTSIPETPIVSEGAEFVFLFAGAQLSVEETTLLNAAIEKGMKVPLDSAAIVSVYEQDFASLCENFPLAKGFIGLGLSDSQLEGLEFKNVQAHESEGSVLFDGEVSGRHCTFVCSENPSVVLADKSAKRRFWEDLKTLMERTSTL